MLCSHFGFCQLPPKWAVREKHSLSEFWREASAPTATRACSAASCCRPRRPLPTGAGGDYGSSCARRSATTKRLRTAWRSARRGGARLKPEASADSCSHSTGGSCPGGWRISRRGYKGGVRKESRAEVATRSLSARPYAGSDNPEQGQQHGGLRTRAPTATGRAHASTPSWLATYGEARSNDPGTTI